MPIEIKLFNAQIKMGRTEIMFTPEEEKELFDCFSEKAKEIRKRKQPTPVEPGVCEVCGKELNAEETSLCDLCREIVGGD